MKPAATLTDICKSHGLVGPSVRYPASVPVRVPPQFPESAMEHDEIGQFTVSVLLKNASHVVKSVEGVISM